MAILKYGTRFGTIGGKITSHQSANLVFQVQGQAFLQWLYNPDDPYAEPNPNATMNNGYLNIQSSTPNKATINYGDGVIETYDFYEYNGVYYLAFSSQIGWTPNASIQNYNPIENHVFQDGYTGLRGVVMSLKKPESIISITSLVVLLRNYLPVEIANLGSLQSLNFTYCQYVTSFPYQWIKLASLQSLILVRISQTLLSEYPTSFLRFENLSNLQIREIFDFSDLDASNARMIGNYGDKLSVLNIAESKMSDIPAEWANLTALTELRAFLNSWTNIPNNVNLIPSIQSLSIGNAFLVGWDNLNLPNLTNLDVGYPSGNVGVGKLSPSFGNTILNSPLLKSIDVHHSFATQSDFDTFIDNFYTFITNNANITGLSTDPWRGMTINEYNANYPLNPANYLPTGTYQQPTGYVQGSANGSPASQFEKVWVLVNQYDHVWKLPPF